MMKRIHGVYPCAAPLRSPMPTIRRTFMSSSVPFSPIPAGSDLKPIPGDPGWPLVGLTLQLMRNPMGIARERYDRYGAASWTNAFGLRMVSLIGPDANEFVLLNKG